MSNLSEPEWIIESRRLANLAHEYCLDGRQTDAGMWYFEAATVALASLPDDLATWTVKRLAAVSRWLRQSIRYDADGRLDHRSLSETAERLARQLVGLEDTAENRLHLAYSLGMFWKAHRPMLSVDEEEAVLREAVDIYEGLVFLNPEDHSLLRSADVADGRLAGFLEAQGRMSDSYKARLLQREIRHLRSACRQRNSEDLRAEVVSEQNLARVSREWDSELACSHEFASIALCRELLSRGFKTKETGLFLAGSLRDIVLFKLSEGLLDEAVTFSEEMIETINRYVKDIERAPDYFDLALIMGARASVLDGSGEEAAATRLLAEVVRLNRKTVELEPSDEYTASLVDSLIVFGGRVFYADPPRALRITREAFNLAMEIPSGDPEGSSDFWWKAVSGSLAAYGAGLGEYGSGNERKRILDLMVDSKHRRSEGLRVTGRSSEGLGDPRRTDAFETILDTLNREWHR